MSHRVVRSFRLMFVLVLFVGLYTAGMPASAHQHDFSRATTDWPTSTPEEQGMDSAALADFIESVPASGAIDSMIIIRNGYVVAEAYWHPFASDLKREMYSASKSVLSALIGIAIDQGYIQSVDQKVLDFFPDIEVENLDANKEAMTVRHLLTMSSGLDCDLAFGTDPLWDLVVRADATEYGLDWKMADAPGTTWRYCQINAYLLSAILTRTTGMDTLAYAKQYLFEPLGITDVDWNVSAEGIALGYCGLMMSTRDMAKIGYLYLNEGRWGEEQIVPAEWVSQSTQTYYENVWGIPNFGFGYLWWMFHTPSGDFYEAHGAYAQRIHISPDKGIVMAFTGEDMNVQMANAVDPTFATAVRNAVLSDEPLSPNPDGVARLAAVVQAAANPEAQPVAALPSMAAAISGKTYRLETPNLLFPDMDIQDMHDEDWQMASLGVDFEQDTATLRLRSRSGIDLSVPVGLDGVFRVTDTYLGTLGVRGRWTTDRQFVLELRRLEEGPVIRYTMNFVDDEFSGRAELIRVGEMAWAQPLLNPFSGCLD